MEELNKKLSEGGIPLDDYVKVMDLAEDLEIERDEDPVVDFKNSVIELNKQKQLPSWLSEWCLVYGVEHNEMEIEPPDDTFDI